MLFVVLPPIRSCLYVDIPGYYHIFINKCHIFVKREKVMCDKVGNGVWLVCDAAGSITYAVLEIRVYNPQWMWLIALLYFNLFNIWAWHLVWPKYFSFFLLSSQHFLRLKLQNNPLPLQVPFWSENILPVMFADVAIVDI